MSDTPETPENEDEMPPARPVYDGPSVSIEHEMKTSYLDYAMSVIVSRAIPDLRDGLKPVHRRILYAMHETNNTHDKSYRKSARAVGEVGELPDPPDIPEMLLRKSRNPFGVAYDPGQSDYADYICTLFHAMMARFVDLNATAVDTGLDLLVFPQGTRSKRLLPGHIGIAQIALYLKVPIVPVGCNGSDGVYPGASPWGSRGRIVYRMGDPIFHEDLSSFHITEAYAPFSATAERDHLRQFQGVADLVTDHIEPLLDAEYRRADEPVEGIEQGTARFV